MSHAVTASARTEKSAAAPRVSSRIRGPRLPRALIVLAALVSAFTVAAPAVAYAGPAELSREIHLPEMPPNGYFVEMKRDIYLNAGRYRWGYYVRGDGGFSVRLGEREIVLAEGRYRWRCAIGQDEPGRQNYKSYCRLRQHGHSGFAQMEDDGLIGGGGTPLFKSFLTELG